MRGSYWFLRQIFSFECPIPHHSGLQCPAQLSLVDLPSGKQSERLILQAREEFKGVRERKWNSERVIVFFAVILRKEPGRQTYGEVRKLIDLRLDMWEQGKFATLCRACVERGKVNTIRRRAVCHE